MLYLFLFLFDASNGITVIALFIRACVSLCSVCVCFTNCLLFVWSIGNLGACVCVGQMPFPPEYLAPPAERMKKERKTKTPKSKKETTGKVREYEGNKIPRDNRNADILHSSSSLYINMLSVFDGTGGHL